MRCAARREVIVFLLRASIARTSLPSCWTRSVLFGLAMVLLARVSRGLGNVDRFGGLIASVVEYVSTILDWINS